MFYPNDSSSTSIDDLLASVRKLPEDASFEDLEQCLARLAQGATKLPDGRRQLLRDGALGHLETLDAIRSPARILDGFLDEAASSESGRSSLEFDDPEPWGKPVAGAAVLDELVETFKRFLAVGRGVAPALALWVMHTHAHAAAQISPILAITSPVKRCGKTTLLTLLEALVPRALSTANISTAAVYRTIEKFRPTLLIDEAGTFLDRDALTGVLNSGHLRGGKVVRTMGDDYDPVAFSTWAPKAIALIGSLRDTLQDRSIEISMRRRLPDEEVESLRLDRLDQFAPVFRRVARWAQDHGDELTESDPTVPDKLDDRAANNWRPLLAIADAAGGDWPTCARSASLVLTGSQEEDKMDEKVMLLEDIHALFQSHDTDQLRSNTIAQELAKMETRPWPEYKNGKGITPTKIASLLKDFGIKSQSLWFSHLGEKGKTLQGYLREDFLDPWRRYLGKAA